MTNEAAKGYMILAAVELELSKRTIDHLELAMDYYMGMKTKSEAELVYRKF